MTHSTKITCPNCNSELDVEEVLGDRIEKQYKQQYQADVAKLTSEYKQKESALAQKEAVLKEQAAEVDKLVIENTQKAIARKEKEILKEAEERAKSHFAVQLKTQSEETAELKKQLQESQAAQLENARLKREMEKQKHATALELQNKLAENEEQIRKSFDERLKAEKENITKQEMERNEKQVAELQKQLTDAKKAAEDAVRKAEQGSQQLQGEVQELMIEEFLTLTFPSDEIGEVKKGVSGADVKQIVRNRIGIESGVILYESKNTQSFQKDWIEKLKTDAEQEKADIAVLVTKTMPKGMEHLGLINGVWVCSVSEFKGLVLALRDNMIKLNEVRMAQTNKGDKMQMLYDYLTDGKFAEQIQRVVLGFKELQEGYEKEKKSQQKIWKKRDEQLEMMFRNTTDFVTQIQVIAGSTLLQLESPEDELLALGAEQE
jgi:hypothetical protein